jgi:hypothetical protein
VPEQKLTNARFYERMNHFIAQDLLLFCNTGDAIIATIDLLMPQQTDFIWSSILSLYWLFNSRLFRSSFCRTQILVLSSLWGMVLFK